MAASRVKDWQPSLYCKNYYYSSFRKDECSISANHAEWSALDNKIMQTLLYFYKIFTTHPLGRKSVLSLLTIQSGLHKTINYALFLLC